MKATVANISRSNVPGAHNCWGGDRIVTRSARNARDCWEDTGHRPVITPTIWTLQIYTCLLLQFYIIPTIIKIHNQLFTRSIIPSHTMLNLNSVLYCILVAILHAYIIVFQPELAFTRLLTVSTMAIRNIIEFNFHRFILIYKYL